MVQSRQLVNPLGPPLAASFLYRLTQQGPHASAHLTKRHAVRYDLVVMFVCPLVQNSKQSSTSVERDLDLANGLISEGHLKAE